MKVLLLLGSVGCAARAEPPSPAPHSSASTLMEQGIAFAARGESLRAEQYLLAALKEGALWAEVVPHLVGACVSAGRLRSALSYVQRAREFRPEDPQLLQLAASLEFALGDIVAARADVEVLSLSSELTAESWLFLGEFYLHETRWSEAKSALARFVALSPADQRVAWARWKLRQIDEIVVPQQGEVGDE